MNKTFKVLCIITISLFLLFGIASIRLFENPHHSMDCGFSNSCKVGVIGILSHYFDKGTFKKTSWETDVQIKNDELLREAGLI